MKATEPIFVKLTHARQPFLKDSHEEFYGNASILDTLLSCPDSLFAGFGHKSNTAEQFKQLYAAEIREDCEKRSQSLS